MHHELPSPLSPRRRWLLISLLLLLALASNLDSQSLRASLIFIADEFHLSTSQYGALSFAPVLPFLMALPLGFLADRTQRTRVLGVGVVLWAISTTLSTLAANFILLFLIRVIVGIGLATTDPLSSSLTSSVFSPAKRSQGMSILATGSIVGGLIAYFGVPPLAESVGWRASFLVIAGPALVLGLALILLPDPSEHDKVMRSQPIQRWKQPRKLALQSLRAVWQATQVAKKSTTQIFHAKGMIFGTLGRGIQELGMATIGIYYPLFLVQYYRLKPASADESFGLILLGATLGAALGGVIAGRLWFRYREGSRFIEAGAATISAGILFFITMLWLPPVWLFLCFSALLGFFLGSTVGPLNSALADVVALEHRSFAYAFQGVCTLLLGIPAAAIGTLADSLGSLRLALVLTAPAILILGGTIIWAAQGVLRREAGQQTAGDPPLAHVLEAREQV